MEALETSIEALTKQIAKLGNNPQPTLSPFTGSTDKRTFQTFVRDFNKVATSMGWTPQDACRHLPIYLRNEASAVYDTLGDNIKKVWQDLLDELAKKFGVGETAHNYRRQIQSRRQR